MTIAIDMVGTNLESGSKSYNINFCISLSKKKLEQKIYIFLTKDYWSLIPNNSNSQIIYKLKPNIYANFFIKILWMQFMLPIELKLLGIKTLFSAMNYTPVILKFSKIRLILATHTNLPWFSFSLMPGNFFKKILIKVLMELSIYSTDKLIVTSEFAKKELQKLLELQKKIDVINLGIDQKYLYPKENNFFLKNIKYEDYFLSIISCARYHNIINILKAFKSLKKEYKKDLKYFLVTQVLDVNYYKEIKEYISNNFKNNEIFLIHDIKSDYLINLYKNANFYIFSSYCEVFGLTSLEAMSQGCPVLISNASALPEINGDAANYFDPDNIDEIKYLMKKVIIDQAFKKNLIDKGRSHHRKFNWDKTVDQTYRLLR